MWLLLQLAGAASAGGGAGQMRFERAVFTTGTQSSGTFVQDRDGFLWMGTNAGGLFRFDGYDVKNFGPGGTVNALSDVYVCALFEDRDGTLWIGTGGGGLNRYDKETGRFTHYRHEPANPNSPSHDTWSLLQWQTIAQTPDGTLWFGTMRGLNAFDKKMGRWIRFLHDRREPASLSDDNISALLVDRSGTLWVGTNGGGLNRLDAGGKSFTRFRHEPGRPGSLSSDRVTCLLEDREGHLWVGTQEGISILGANGVFSRLKKDPADPRSLGDDRLLALTQDRDGRIWCGYVSTGLVGTSFCDPRTRRFTHFRHDPLDPATLSSNAITRVVEDRTGILWFLNDGGPVDKVDPNHPAFRLYRHRPGRADSLLAPAVVAVHEDRERRLWVGTFPKGLSTYDKRTGRFDHHLKDRYYPGICQDRSGLFWLGACFPGDLLLYDASRRKVLKTYRHDPSDPHSIAYSMQVNAIVPDARDPGVLWLATQTGLERFDTRREVFTHFGPGSASPATTRGSHQLWMLLQDSAGILWLPTVGGGLDRFDPATGVFTHYRHDPGDSRSISADSVNVVFEDREGRLWVGTAVGFDLMDRSTGHFRRFNASTGHPVHSVITIGQDQDGLLWMGSAGGDGLARFDPRTGAIKLFRETDGLQSDIFYVRNALRDHDGEMWFGGIRGLNSFHPRELRGNPHVPTVVITALRQGAEELRLDCAPERAREITLDWTHNYFEFEYSALNYTNAGSNQYRFKLEGHDKDWFAAGTRRFGRYSGLKAGTYTLRILGSNNDGRWNETGVSLKVRVRAPWWQTGWFLSLVGAGLILLVSSFFRMKNREIRAVRAAAKALQEGEQRYRMLFENSPVGLCLSRPDGQIQAINRTLQDMLGGPADGDWLNLLADEEDRAALRTRISGDGILRYGATLTTRDGGRFEADLTLSPLTSSGQPALLVAVVDVTDRKHAEAEQRRLQQQLLHAQKIESIGTLASGIAHDFNNILNIILSNASLLGDGRDNPDKAPRRIEAITMATERGAGLVKQLLAFARKNDPEWRPLAPNDLVLELVKLLEETFPKSIEVDLDLAQDLPMVLGDPTHLHQVLLNLCVNARDAMPGGGRLGLCTSLVPLDELRTRFPAASSPHYVRVAIRDTGAGMDEKTLERVFDPFFTTKGIGRGTGLGLSVVLGIVQAHGGFIDAESREGEGTEFRVLLPASGRGTASTMKPEPGTAEVPGGNETILLVEDETATREFLQECLEGRGYRVLVAADGAEGVALFQRNAGAIDLVVSDLGLPKLGGEDVFRRVHPQARVLITSGFIAPDVRERLLAEGIEGILAKPYKAQDLLRKVREILDRARTS